MARALPPSLLLAVSLALALGPASARAEPHALRYDLATDGAMAAGGWLLYLSSELAKEHLAPERCRLCGTNALDADTRDLLVRSPGDGARHASDALAFVLLPAGMAAHQLLAARGAGDGEAGLVDVLLVAEAAALAMDLNQIVKFAVGRQRPFVRYGNSPEADRRPDADDNLSFYSGHTTFTFALAAAAGTVSDLRGYRSAPWVWGVGLTLAATTGYLRIAADRHYLTDVLVGAAIGTALGIVLPRALHGREGEDGGTGPAARVTAVPLGFAIAF
jgi:membrane-associated phospholipid phosphatase